jgi:3-deoxy-D-manno-octulosonate 8-phosphate phosphatase (KDO 8-P phosphatase)
MKTDPQFSATLLASAQNVKVVFFDVDGVLTDGGLYFSESGESIKRFNTLDGHGIKLLQQAGITPVVISGRDSAPLRLRLSALGVNHAFFGTEDKKPCAEQTLHALGLTWKQAAAMGDDWPDIPVMQNCVISSAPPNAHSAVRALAGYITLAQGGQGAVREFCDLLMLASGQYSDLLRKYTQ